MKSKKRAGTVIQSSFTFDFRDWFKSSLVDTYTVFIPQIVQYLYDKLELEEENIEEFLKT